MEGSTSGNAASSMDLEERTGGRNIVATSPRPMERTGGQAVADKNAYWRPSMSVGLADLCECHGGCDCAEKYRCRCADCGQGYAATPETKENAFMYVEKEFAVDVTPLLCANQRDLEMSFTAAANIIQDALEEFDEEEYNACAWYEALIEPLPVREVMLSDFQRCGDVIYPWYAALETARLRKIIRRVIAAAVNLLACGHVNKRFIEITHQLVTEMVSQIVTLERLVPRGQARGWRRPLDEETAWVCRVLEGRALVNRPYSISDDWTEVDEGRLRAYFAARRSWHFCFIVSRRAFDPYPHVPRCSVGGEVGASGSLGGGGDCDRPVRVCERMLVCEFDHVWFGDKTADEYLEVLPESAGGSGAHAKYPTPLWFDPSRMTFISWMTVDALKRAPYGPAVTHERGSGREPVRPRVTLTEVDNRIAVEIEWD